MFDKFYNGWWVCMESAQGGLISRWLSDILSMRKRQGGKRGHSWGNCSYLYPWMKEEGESFFLLKFYCPISAALWVRQIFTWRSFTEVSFWDWIALQRERRQCIASAFFCFSVSKCNKTPNWAWNEAFNSMQYFVAVQFSAASTAHSVSIRGGKKLCWLKGHWSWL